MYYQSVSLIIFLLSLFHCFLFFVVVCLDFFYAAIEPQNHSAARELYVPFTHLALPPFVDFVTRVDSLPIPVVHM